MNAVRVVIANEPRAYREAMGGALGALCPQAQVSVVGPDELDGEVLRLQPQVVLCSEITETVRGHVPTWISLYPGGQALVVVCVDGHEPVLAALALDGLIAIVDRTRGRAGTGGAD